MSREKEVMDSILEKYAILQKRLPALEVRNTQLEAENANLKKAIIELEAKVTQLQAQGSNDRMRL